jgi:hypothetical protein
MVGYRVSFFKHLLSSDGHPRRCLQEQLEVPEAESVERAIHSATRQFETLHGLTNWKLFADAIEVDAAERS